MQPAKEVVVYGLVFVLSLLFLWFYQFHTPYLPDTDGYYHMKLAYLLREQGFMSDFKWAHLSLWREHYSDKEFLYHLYLIPFTFFEDLIFGAKAATAVMAAVVFTSFFAVLRLNGVRHAWFWLLLLSASGGYFLYRVNVPRPQGLSIVFVLWAVHFLLNRKRPHLAVLCFLYTYSYTAFHLPVIFALIIYFYQLAFERENDWRSPAAAAAGTAAGMLLSPFFPDKLLLFYVQNFYILWMGSGFQSQLRMAGEFGPMNTRSAVVVNAAALLPFIAAFFTALYAPAPRPRELRALFLIALATIVLTCLARRFAEYSVPLTLMFCAFFFSPYLERWREWAPSWKGKLLRGAGALALLAPLSVNSYLDTSGEFRGVDPPRLDEAAQWLEAHTFTDELVFTADWDDAPELFFFNHKNRYLVFLDPNFMYYWDPATWRKWDAVARGRYGDSTYDVLRDSFGVRYGVATSEFQNLRGIIERDPRMAIVFETPEAYVFELRGTRYEDNFDE